MAKKKAKKAAKKVVKKAAKKAPAKKAVKKSKPSSKKSKVLKPAKKKVVKKAKVTKPVKKKTLKKAVSAKKKVVKKVSAKKSAPSKKKIIKKVVAKKTKAAPVKKKIIKKVTPVKKSAPKKPLQRGDLIKKEISKVVDTVQTAIHNAATFAHNVIDKIEHKLEERNAEQEKFVAHSTSLNAGNVAPYFEGVDQHGNTVRSSELLGKNVVLYFYPKDNTPGCTAESCSLRDEYHYFNDNNTVIIGVSADSVDSHKKFAEDYMLPFSLIADTEKKIITAYDVWGPKQLAGKIYDGIVRTTFVIDADGIIKHIVTKVDSANHAQQLRSL
jgi:peroxiredoxin Q/BCP